MPKQESYKSGTHSMTLWENSSSRARTSPCAHFLLSLSSPSLREGLNLYQKFQIFKEWSDLQKILRFSVITW